MSNVGIAVPKMNISVLIGTYGDESWHRGAIERAAPSVKNQSKPAHEILAAHDEWGTLAKVRNLLAQNATGDWLCFLDADDELDPHYLEEMEKRWYQGISHPADFFDRGPLIVPAVSYLSEFEADTTQRTLPMIPNEGRWPKVNECVIGTLIPRNTFLQVGGFREFEAYEDWDLWLRCYAAGAKLWYAPSAVYLAHVSSSGRNQPRDPQSVYDEIWNDYGRLLMPNRPT